jgi:hypothetical protein
MAVDKRLYLFVHPRRPFERVVGRLAAWAEYRAGNRDPWDDQLDRSSRRGWPVDAAVVDWLADRLDDLGNWLWHRNAARWARREGRR